MIDINSKPVLRSGNHKKFISSEGGCTHIGMNPNECKIRQYKIDGGVYAKSTSKERCNYLLLNDTNPHAFFIELKGSDLVKAIRQVDETVDDIKPGIPQYSIQRRIIYRTGSHDIRSSYVLRWKRKYGKSAVIKQKKLEEML